MGADSVRPGKPGAALSAGSGFLARRDSLGIAASPYAPACKPGPGSQPGRQPSDRHERVCRTGSRGPGLQPARQRHLRSGPVAVTGGRGCRRAGKRLAALAAGVAEPVLAACPIRARSSVCPAGTARRDLVRRRHGRRLALSAGGIPPRLAGGPARQAGETRWAMASAKATDHCGRPSPIFWPARASRRSPSNF